MDYSKKSKEDLIKEIEGLKDHERNISIVLDNMEEMFYKISFNKNGKKTFDYISPQIEKVLGLPIKQYIDDQDKLFEYFHPDDVDHLFEEINQKDKSKNKSTFTYRFYNKKIKKYVWIEETFIIYYNEDGTRKQLLGTAKNITENKEFDIRLKKSEKSYKDLFDNSPDLLYILDENAEILDVNKIVLNKYGYRKRELIGKKLDFLSVPNKNDITNLLKKIELAWGGKKQIFEFWSHKKDKTVFPKEIILRKGIYFGKMVLIATARDITEKKIAENHLKENEEKYRNLFKKNLAGVFISENGIIKECNNSFAQILGYKSRVQLIGKKSIELYFSKKDRENYLVDIRKKGYLTNYKLRQKKKDGSEIWIFTNVTLLEDNSKKNYKIEGTIIEITEQIKREQLEKEKIKLKLLKESNKVLQNEILERKKIEEEFIQNQQYTNSIISSSLDIICSSNNDGVIKEYNKAAEQAFGYTPEEISNKSISILYADKETYFKVSKELKEKHTFVGEIKNRRKNGEIFTSFLSASVLYDSSGKNIGTMGVSRNITELKKAEKQLIESEEKYRDIFENATDLIQSVDRDGKILYVNNSWKKTLGYSERELSSKTIFDIIHSDGLIHYKNFFNRIMTKGLDKSEKVLFEFKTKDNEKVTVEGYISCKKEENKTISTRAILRDVTEEIKNDRRQAVYNNIAKIITEETDSDTLYENVRKELGKVVNTDIFIISRKKDGETIEFPYYYDYTKGGKIEKDQRKNKKGINEYFLKERKPKILYREELDKFLEKKEYKLIGKKSKVFVGVPLKIKNKTIGVLSVQSYTNRDEYSDYTVQILDFISGALALAVQRIADENIIYEQSARLKSIIESSSHMFWTYDKQKGVTSFNKKFSDEIDLLYGTKPKIIKDQKIVNRVIRDDRDQPFWDQQYEKVFKGKTAQFTVEKSKLNGDIVVNEIFLNPIFNEDNSVLEVSGISHDVTEKKLAEEELKESLKEKEVLLKEVHHRVKNNMQVISSILNLQSSYIKDEKTQNIFKESQNRIKAMAFIHESLYQTNDFSKIKFSEYITGLSKNLLHSYDIFDGLVDLKLNIGEVYLNLDLSIPCGLIINELVSNSLKYAFEEGERGTISIDLFNDNGIIRLSVSDSGKGLPKNIDYRDTDSLGLQLVVTLVEQINGELELDNTKGANYKIAFKQEQ